MEKVRLWHVISAGSGVHSNNGRSLPNSVKSGSGPENKIIAG